MMNNEQTANTIHFPEEIFSKILSYNNNSVERRQRQLWDSITMNLTSAMELHFQRIINSLDDEDY